MDTEIIFISTPRTYLIQSKKTLKKIKESHKDKLINYDLSYSKKKTTQNYLFVPSSILISFPLVAVDNAKIR